MPNPKAEPATSWCTDEFLKAIPKSDLHVHLDGSLRLDTLVELARDAPGVTLPSEDLGVLRRDVFKRDFASLEEYLAPFAYTTGCLQTAANLERVAYEFAIDNFAEGVRYFEVRFAPQLHCSVEPSQGFGIVEVLQAVNAGLARARDEANAKLHAGLSSGQRSGEPEYEYGIIACAMRMFFPGMSRYYDALFALHPHASSTEVTSMASVNLVRASKDARDAHGVPVVAIDVAGAERDYEATVHADAFQLAHSFAFGKTVHAGEGFGPESIWQAVRDLHAERIGHGFHLFSTSAMTSNKHIAEDGTGQAFVDRLVKYVSDRRITLEVRHPRHAAHVPPRATLLHQSHLAKRRTPAAPLAGLLDLQPEHNAGTHSLSARTPEDDRRSDLGEPGHRQPPGQQH